MSQQSARLASLIKASVESLGYELWGVVFQPRSQHQTLVIFIDAPAGVTLDDCSKVSRLVSERLDEEDPIHGAYMLEVSSPGIDRQLFTVEQFQRYIGKEVKVEMRMPINGQRRFKGRLLSANENEICIDDKKQQSTLAMDDVLKANLVTEI